MRRSGKRGTCSCDLLPCRLLGVQIQHKYIIQLSLSSTSPKHHHEQPIRAWKSIPPQARWGWRHFHPRRHSRFDTSRLRTNASSIDCMLMGTVAVVKAPAYRIEQRGTEGMLVFLKDSGKNGRKFQFSPKRIKLQKVDKLKPALNPLIIRNS